MKPMQSFVRSELRARRAGFSALELSVSTVLLVLTAGLSITAIDKLQRVANQTSSSSKLQEDAERALDLVATRLQLSGVTIANFKSYPHLFPDGAAGAGFENHQHAAPVVFPIRQNGVVVVPDPANVEIVFVQPIDADLPGEVGFGIPDVDAAGDLAWDTVEHSFVVVPISADTNELQYRQDAAPVETLATGVESFVCSDTAAVAGVPRSSILIELTLRARDESGRLTRYTTRRVVRLRNGEG